MKVMHADAWWTSLPVLAMADAFVSLSENLCTIRFRSAVIVVYSLALGSPNHLESWREREQSMIVELGGETQFQRSD
jgi:hypothetical protein